MQHAPGSFIPVDHAAPQPRDAQSSIVVPRARYGQPQFDCPIGSPPVEFVIGSNGFLELELSPAIPAQFEVVRAPLRPNGEPFGNLAGRRLNPQAPGVYVIGVTLPGDWRREITVLVFGVEVLERLDYPRQMPLERQMRLRALVRDPRVTRETAVAALESGPVADLRVLLGIGPKQPLNLKVFN